MTKQRRARRLRLDELLVARGLCADVDQARRTVWAGQVIVDGELVDQPASLISDTAGVRLRARHRFATRGGEKLDEAMAAFGVNARGRCAIDVGAAGGGFTDCLLSLGVSQVYAVDIGRGQLAQRLRLDPIVVDLGGRDIMALESGELDPRPTLGVVDVTFRSLSAVLPKVMELLVGEREIVALVKPLHEARLAGLGRVAELQQSVFAWLLPRLRESDVPVRDILASSVSGPGGSLEFFLHARYPGLAEAELRARVSQAVLERQSRESSAPLPKRSGRKRRITWQRLRPRSG